MYIASLENTPKTKMDMEGAYKVFKQIPLSSKHGAPTYSFRVFTLEPGGHTPLHRHENEHMNYIIEGAGNLVIQGKHYNVKKGDFALVLPGEEHQYRNTSTDEPMVMICAVPKEYE
ncbi:MAG: cupin domain-containing protein [Dehalococcoidales bacterium]